MSAIPRKRRKNLIRWEQLHLTPQERWDQEARVSGLKPWFETRGTRLPGVDANRINGEGLLVSSFVSCVVFDGFPLNKIDNIFGDVRRMISNPLQVSADQDQMYRSSNRLRIFHHVGKEFAKNLIIKAVNLIVLSTN